MQGMIDWNDLRFFLALAQGRTLSAAAQRLAVSASTVSRRITALEQALRVQLFRPHRDGYELTEAGHALVPAAEDAGARMAVFERHGSESLDDHAGPVRIEAPELLGHAVLLPAIIEMMAQYPGLRIELRGAVQPTRLAAEEADIVLRLLRPSKGNYRLRRLGVIRFGLYASAEHVRTQGLPQSPGDLNHHRVVGWTEDLSFLAMAGWLDRQCPGLRPGLRLTSFSAQVQEVEQGAGWAVLPDFIARPAGFVPLPTLPALEAELSLLVQEQAAALARVRLVCDQITRVLRKQLER